MHEAARVLGRRVIFVNAATAGEIDAAFAALTQQRAAALLVTTNPFYLNRRDQIIALAAQHKIPTIYSNREFITADGLMSYGNNLPDAYRRNGIYVGRILKGDGRATCQSTSRPNSSWSLILRPPRPSVSICRCRSRSESTR